MNIEKLFLMQKELDQEIENNHPRQEGESRHQEKVVSLLVELGELANELRFFKFWSYKPASQREVILEEFVDGIHFLLSLGLEMSVKEFDIHPIVKSNLTEQFIGLYNAISILGFAFSGFAYGQAFSAYLGLGELLGFAWEEIEAFYGAKNSINHARQQENY